MAHKLYRNKTDLKSTWRESTSGKAKEQRIKAVEGSWGGGWTCAHRVRNLSVGGW